MPGKALYLVNQLQGQPQPGIAGVQPDLAQTGLGDGARPAPAPDLPRQRGQRILGQTHRAPHLAHRALAAIMDHRGAKPGAVAAIAVIDVLDHLLAPLMLEIHVDIRRLVTGLGDEAFEHHRADLGRDRSDAQRIADHRIGGRPPPLTQDPPRAGKGHDVMHRQEIWLIAQLANQRQFMRHLCLHLGRRARRVAPAQPFLRQPRQPILRGLAPRHLRGVFIAQLVQRKADACRDLARAMHGILMAGEDP